MIQKSLAIIPDSPGVYRFYGESDKLLYVGKAKSLKKRVKSYFRFAPEFGVSLDVGPRTAKMLSETLRLEWTLTSCEADALTLENSLIKNLRPKYNILLRDDKTYPYIMVDYEQDYPRLEITRNVKNDGKKKFYGPFVGSVKELLNAIYETYPLVQKKSCLNGKKACLFYQIDRCLAPCQFKIDKALYGQILQNACGCIFERKPLIDALERKMLALSEQERFEEALSVRDTLFAIQKMNVQSGVDFAKDSNFDAVQIVNDAETAALVRVFVRDGKIVSLARFIIRGFDHGAYDEAYRTAILDFYTKDNAFNVKEIIIGHKIDDLKPLEDGLSAKVGRKIVILAPKIGEKKEVLEFAKLNGFEAIRTVSEKSNVARKLKELFGLDFAPNKIEAFDASHLGGKNSVAAMICFENGAFEKSGYRLFHLDGADEYSQMREALTRRALSFDKIAPPDLWLIDGGLAQETLAREIISSCGVFVEVASIAKAKIVGRANRSKGLVADRLFYGGQEIKLLPSDQRLQFLQTLRDEAHRFALSFQRKTRAKESKNIALMSEAGIKIGVISKLLAALGGFADVQKASKEALCDIIGEKYANKVYEFYHGD